MSLTLFLILLFLAGALLFYVLFAGADFGAGILELALGRTRRDEQRALVSHAMAPVWEANHVWLVLAVVILFMGFPLMYEALSVSLHLPMMAVLVGIVARGCAFTFRHYDTLTRSYYDTYSRVFAASSLWTSFFLGVLAGALVLGRIAPDAKTYAEAYLAPWLNAFCFVFGLFTVCLFALLAAIYLMGETPDAELKDLFRRRARFASMALVGLGPVLFGAAELSGLPLVSDFLGSGLSLFSLVAATALLVPFWRQVSTHARPTPVRILGAAIVLWVLLGWYAAQYPVALRIQRGGGVVGLTFEELAAPAATLRALLLALLVGSALIFPALVYLLKVFKWETFQRERRSP